jgi:hypothetical protein
MRTRSWANAVAALQTDSSKINNFNVFMGLLAFETPSVDWAHYGLSRATVSSAFRFKPQPPVPLQARFWAAIDIALDKTY